eukprot:5690108-Pyramimonas_sp.AAC.1
MLQHYLLREGTRAQKEWTRAAALSPTGGDSRSEGVDTCCSTISGERGLALRRSGHVLQHHLLQEGTRAQTHPVLVDHMEGGWRGGRERGEERIYRSSLDA